MEGLKIKLSFTISLTLFLSGLILILMQIPYWGTFLGIPLIIIGTCLSIVTFDRLNQETLEDELSRKPDS